MSSAPLATTTPEPRLAPPGAGLPGPELMIARLLFRLRSTFTSRQSAEALIAREREAINAIVVRREPAALLRRVLIPRPRGLEDSSRNWSVLMTLEHLRLVNEATASTIVSLLAGRIPAREANTANVKPSPDVDMRVIAAFDQSCARLSLAGQDAPSLGTRALYRHPWFGPLDARKWKLLGGVHLALHRGQIETILAARAAE